MTVRRIGRAAGWAVCLLGWACSCAAAQGIPPGIRPGAPVPAPSPALPAAGSHPPAAGSQLPPTAPSSAGAPAPGVPAAVPGAVLPVTLPVAPAAAPALAVHRPRVTFADGQLAVTAENSSLNQILREIARVTGMRITGGVMDERVFGTYGPGDTGAVLAVLLNGTGSNMMLTENADRSPQELVLTLRQGGPTPPNPMAGRDEGTDDLPPQLTPRVSNVPNATAAQPAPAAGTQLPDAAPDAAPGAQTPPAAIPASATTASSTTTEQSPNGVKTPQQIYDELMKLQQQAKTPAPK